MTAMLQPLTLTDPIGPKTPVLDHGYIQAIEAWGCDERIIEAARMSTGKGFLGWGNSTYIECLNPNGSCVGYSWQTNSSENDAITERTDLGLGMRCPFCSAVLVVNKAKSRIGDGKLLRYLYEHKHATPFEMAGLVIEVQAPIFVFREWRTHRTCTQTEEEMFWDDAYNEMSARYTPLPYLNYIPTIERLLINSKSNKQAGTVKGAEELTEEKALEFQAALSSEYEYQEKIYQTALANGVPKELARIHLPVGRYSRMRASANLRNWLAFLTLRMDAAAQWEIRQYANEVGVIISQLYPRTWELFVEDKKI